MIAIVISIVFLIAVQCYPEFMNNFVIIVGLVMIILTIIFVVLQKNINYELLIVFSACMIILFGMILYGALKSRICLNLHGVFLKYAAKLVS